jgi:hypothetical protein
MTDYKYDVFLSYKYNDRFLPWIKEFERSLSFWLTQELGGRQAKIYFDTEYIQSGTKIKEALKDAVISSKCMIGIWSPEYFHSKYCVSEWKSFLARERMLGGKIKLILPVSIHDGEHFPDETTNIRIMGLQEYSSTSNAFWNTAKSVELEEMIKIFAREVGIAVLSAPEFDPKWPFEECEPISRTSPSLSRF